MSRRPKPYTLFGYTPAVLLQDAEEIRTAVSVRRCSMALTLPFKVGKAESSTATPPATWGPAMEVPLMVV